jgi:phospholipid transport system substrate-binding protein
MIHAAAIGRVRLLPVLLPLLLAMVPASLAVADAETTDAGFPSERAVVDRLHEALLDSMRSAAQSSFEERREVLRAVLFESFDFPFMAEKSAGRYWRDLDGDQRLALTAALTELALSNYAARFNEYDGERFEIVGADAAAYETVLVRSRIVQKGGTVTRLDYRLRSKGAGLARIVDVFLNGTVSELAMRRAEYSSVIKREGFDVLLAALRERVAALPVSARR